MREYFKLAWRNIWRNKRRTMITAASIFFAVFIAIVMRSFQLGSYDHMINNFVESYSGYIQVQHDEFWEKRGIDYMIELNDTLVNKVQNVENVKAVVPRLESFALASSGNNTKGSVVMGVDPEKENTMTNAKDKLVKYRLTEQAIQELEQNASVPENIMKKLKELKNESYSGFNKILLDLDVENGGEKEYFEAIRHASKFPGEYLSANENAVLVADKLAKFLNLGVGDTIILISQGYHGRSASGLFEVKGIIDLPNPELNRSFIYMPLSQAQDFYSAYNMVTSLAINVHDNDDEAVQNTTGEIRDKLHSETYAVMDWKEMNKELVQQIQSDNASGKLILAILYVIIAFGIFSTVLMMTAERKREFGVMVAVGMQKFKLAGIVTIELIILGLIGLSSGMLASIPAVLVGNRNPIRLTGELAESMESFGLEPVMPFATIDFYYVNQALVVLALIVIAMLYPVYSITKIKVVNALRA
jgi:ABC-type lipoprotein release transport system permease subunit